MQCIKCRREVNEQIEKCPICGTPTSFSKQYKRIQEENNQSISSFSDKIFIGIIIFLILLFIGFSIYFMYHKKNKDQTNSSKPPVNHPTIEAIDITKKNLVETTFLNYIRTIELHVVYSLLDPTSESNFKAGIYQIKDQKDQAILNTIEMKIEPPLDGWFVLDEKGTIIAAELKFSIYNKAIGYIQNQRPQAILNEISKTPNTIEEALKVVELDLKK